jgi:shikimate kinase
MLNASAASDQNLVLTGYLGPEQRAIARRTAELLRMPFVDFDARLEARAEMPAEEVRALYGESRLKTLEDEMLSEIGLYRGALILISGETLMRGALEPLRATGPVICLTASVDAVLQRLHLALGARFHDPRERDLALGRVRRAWSIRSASGVTTLDTSHMSDGEMTETIATRWRELAGIIDWRG